MNRFLRCVILLVVSSGCSEPGNDAGQISEASPAAPTREVLSGADLFVLACQGCHSIAADAPDQVGPNLFGIAESPAASSEGFRYSPALQESGLTWTTANLTAWVVAAETLVPGTWMLYHNVLQPDEVTRLIRYIENPNTALQP